MSNLRRILPLLLCLSLLCACVQMPNAPKDETPLQSPLPTATPESSTAPAPTATPEPTMVPAMATAHDNATRTAPVIEDPAVWDDNAEKVLTALEKQFASYGMTLTAKEGYPYLLAVNNAGGTVTVYTVDAATGRVLDYEKENLRGSTGGTDIGAEGVINEIQLTEATIGYLEGWLTQDENYTSVRTHAADTFSKNTERAAAANSAGASLLLSVHGNSDPYSSDSYGLECYPQPPGRTHHEDSLRLAHLIADKFGAAGQRLRGNAGVRYIYYAGDDESGYEKQVVEESDSTVYSEQTFGLLEKTDCPAVLVEQCFVTSEVDVAAWGTDDGCRRAARLYYEAICEYFGTEPLPGT